MILFPFRQKAGYIGAASLLSRNQPFLLQNQERLADCLPAGMELFAQFFFRRQFVCALSDIVFQLLLQAFGKLPDRKSVV